MKIPFVKNRSTFEAAYKKGLKVTSKGVNLQLLPKSSVFEKKLTDEFSTKNLSGIENAWFGITASKKTGNSVCRNLAKRRIREVIRHISKNSPELFKPDNIYIFIAREHTKSRDFSSLIKDAKYTLHNIEKGSN